MKKNSMLIMGAVAIGAIVLIKSMSAKKVVTAQSTATPNGTAQTISALSAAATRILQDTGVLPA